MTCLARDSLAGPASSKMRYHYVCQRCTACYRWTGDVEVEDEEIAKIAVFLGMAEHEFVQEFTRIRANRTDLSLVDKDASSECIMLEGDECRIYEVKLVQCREFPNGWKFPDWEKECEAIAVSIKGEA